jgi:hypothetical protein
VNLVAPTDEFAVHNIERKFDVLFRFPLDGGSDAETLLMALPRGLTIAA